MRVNLNETEQKILSRCSDAWGTHPGCLTYGYEPLGVLKRQVQQLVNSEEFKKLKEKLTTGLIISSIIVQGIENLRPAVVRAFKFLVAFETLSGLQTDNYAADFQTLLHRSKLLSKEVFPVNFESEKLIKEKKNWLKKGRIK